MVCGLRLSGVVAVPVLPVLSIFALNGRDIWQGETAEDFAPKLKQLSLMTFIYTLVFGSSLILV